MLNPLTTVTRYGNIFKVVRFEKALTIGGHPTQYFRRIKSKGTVKLSQNIHRAKNKINEYITICNHSLQNPAFATFTYKEPQHDVEQAIQDWRRFTYKMKRHYPDVAFLKVPERHKSGAVHFHAVMFGLPSDLPCSMSQVGKFWKHSCPSNKLCERSTRSLAKIWGKGFVDLAYARKPESLGAYVSKYLTKGDPDWTLFGCHVYSPNSKMFEVIRKAKKDGLYYRFSTSAGQYVVDFIENDLKGCLTPIKIGEFDTHWLGKAKYELSKINENS